MGAPSGTINPHLLTNQPKVLFLRTAILGDFPAGHPTLALGNDADPSATGAPKKH